MVEDLAAQALAWQKSLPPSPARDRAAAGGRVENPRKPAKPGPDRAAMFRAKDTNHDGRLTLEEYLHNFPDEAEGRRRFQLFDTNRDGALSEEEFIKMDKL